MALGFTAQHDAVPAFSGLINRSRWLFLSLGVLYAWTWNGAWVWPGLGAFSPTWEGMEMGGERITRLALVLAALALVLQKLSRDDLVYGLYLLAWPFAKMGFDRRAFAVRVALAMELARTERRAYRPGMLDVLQSTLSGTECTLPPICLESRAFAWTDGLALALMLAILGLNL